ncbi:hypothetical protein [Floridanema aerugineum]|uniref:Uncharacterized protein n=1 Tax=Floridaenema aerugineum BLCC-F46 TaxID=3153654 RepID=A0ABV4XGV1_9CYAN
MPSSHHQNLNNTDFHLPYNRQLIARAKELRKNSTPAEKSFGKITSEPLNFEFCVSDQLITSLLIFTALH